LLFATALGEGVASFATVPGDDSEEAAVTEASPSLEIVMMVRIPCKTNRWEPAHSLLLDIRTARIEKVRIGVKSM